MTTATKQSYIQYLDNGKKKMLIGIIATQATNHNDLIMKCVEVAKAPGMTKAKMKDYRNSLLSRTDLSTYVYIYI